MAKWIKSSGESGNEEQQNDQKVAKKQVKMSGVAKNRIYRKKWDICAKQKMQNG